MKKLLPLILFPLTILSGYAQSLDCIIPRPTEIISGTEKTKNLTLIEENVNACTAPEAYELKLTPKGCTLIYATPEGKQRALATLQQLDDQLAAHPEGIPTGTIKDQPAYPWRGMMIDVARHYYPLSDLKQFVDAMHLYKFNKLHIHLTDDQGWRLPIPGYPKLQSISSKREEMEGNKTPTEGMYTKDELKELVAYCKDKGIEVIPEVDLPGHNQALAAAYPEFFCSPEPGLKVRTTAGVSKDLICPQKKDAYTFLGKVFDELADIFPSKIVHLGGDEAPTDKWEKCPECTQARKDHEYKDCHDQMRAFFADMSQMLEKRGKEPQFWYEDNANTYKSGQTVFSWRLGKTPSTIEHTNKAGLKLILTPGEHCYIDYPQIAGHSNRGWMPLCTLEQSYKLDPTYGLSQDKIHHIIGVHCTLWTEYLPTMEHVFYRAYPRAMAIAEKGWSPKEQWSEQSFKQRLNAQKAPFQKRFTYTLERTKDNEPKSMK